MGFVVPVRSTARNRYGERLPTFLTQIPLPSHVRLDVDKLDDRTANDPIYWKRQGTVQQTESQTAQVPDHIRATAGINH
jgi:hypothetical protein